MTAPFHMVGWVETLIIGFLFGFVLERAGFGNSRNLAAQFYLTDMRVLKVMFTAIVTAMVLIFAASAVGWLDFEQLWVTPTHLGPAVIGGLALGFGFVLGGYCPGTSLVSAATAKIDGIVFALGVAFGLFVFGLTAPWYAGFWENAGFLGRLTWPDVLGIDAGLVVLGVLVMAVGAFAAAEWAERRFTVDSPASLTRPSRPRVLAAITAVATVIVLATVIVGQPDTERRIAWQHNQLQQQLQSREVFADPGEVYELLHNRQIELLLLDVRSEADYNIFHLRDARHVTLDELEHRWVTQIDPKTVVIVMSNDEARAVEAWKRLAVHINVNAYIMAGGVNRWLDVYLARRSEVPGPDVPPDGDDTFRYRYIRAGDMAAVPVAWGDRLSAARPDPRNDNPPEREFTSRVEILSTVKLPSGGCG